MDFLIRKFEPKDKESIRTISCETAFLGRERKKVFDDDEILADFLTLYFTDYETGSCFVATYNDEVIGYLIGSKDIRKASNIIISKIIPKLILKIFFKKTFLKFTNLKFLFYLFLSFLKGEFFIPRFYQDFPATLHINIKEKFRGYGVGKKLIESFLSFLKDKKIKGVHFGTISEEAKKFFLKLGFKIIYTKKRTYLKPYIKKNLNLYVFAKNLY